MNSDDNYEGPTERQTAAVKRYDWKSQLEVTSKYFISAFVPNAKAILSTRSLTDFQLAGPRPSWYFPFAIVFSEVNARITRPKVILRALFQANCNNN